MAKTLSGQRRRILTSLSIQSQPVGVSIIRLVRDLNLTLQKERSLAEEKPNIFRYGIAILAVTLISLSKLQFFNNQLNSTTTFLPLLGAVLISAWFGGLGPAILATFMSAVIADYYFLPPAKNWWEINKLVLVLIFILEGLTISFLSRFRSQAEEVRSRLAEIVESSVNAIIGMDLQGTITDWNRGARLLYGYTENEMIGKSIKTLIPTEYLPEFLSLLRYIKVGKRVKNYEISRLARDHRLIDVSLSISPIRNSTGRIIGASAIARDITESKQTERRKDEFIATASHELKTPVTSLKAYNQLLKKSLNKLKDKRIRHYVIKMDDQISRLSSLVVDLLDVTRVQSDELPLRIERFNLSLLIKETIEDIQPTSKKHKIILEGRKRLIVNADKNRLNQVVTNLISNAIKYSPSSSKIIVKILAKKRDALFSVQDFGQGIEPRDQDKIFERFFRVKDDQTSGLGMGLYICAVIIKRHRGKIWVDSKLDQGSTFFFSLPLNT